MKPQKKKSMITRLALLAVVCIIIAELIACRIFDPALFDTITAPAITAAGAIVTTTERAIDDLSRSIQASINESKAQRQAKKAQREAEKAQREAEKQQEFSAPDTSGTASVTEELENQSATAPLLNIPSSICDPSVTELKVINDLEILTGGPVKVVCYLQSDERWGQLKYGSDRISTHGCGPTAMAMVVSSMTDTVILPQDMAQWAVDHGHWARRSGSYHSIVIDAATFFGLDAKSYPLRNTDALREELMSGNLFVALMGPGHFTQSGHFIILRGVTLSGDILVADPGSLDRSLTAWDAQLIFDELSKSTASGSPLWIISPSENKNPE